MDIYDIVIIGAGPAGLTAGLYASRSQKKTLIIESKAPGGQLMNTELIDDYPGVESVLGVDLAAIMHRQAAHFGAEFLFGEALAIKPAGNLWEVAVDEDVISAKAIIITAGGTPRYLEVPGEKELAGMGVSYCAVCDGAFFKAKDLIVVGGGDAAVEEAIYLTRYAKTVTVVHRSENFRASPILLEAARQHPQINIVTNCVVEEILGAGKVQQVRLRNVHTREENLVSTDGVFIFIGFIPNTHFLPEHTQHDEFGYYITDPKTMMTSAAGIFAAGDVRSQLTRQITTAVGDATTATIAAVKWIERKI